MSGHSKWATIKRQKGAADAKRGQLFTKLANAIVIAVKQGGGIADPESNFKLRLAVDRARSYNMPKENIERAIQKALGASGVGELQEVIYEGFTANGNALLIEAVTDNKQRTVAEVKNILEKSGGRLAGQGAVSYLFQRIGEIVINALGLSEEEIFNIAIDINSTDYFKDGENVIFYVEAHELANAKKKLEKRKMIIENAQIVFKPKQQVNIGEAKEKLIDIISKLESLGDVQNVYSNALV